MSKCNQEMNKTGCTSKSRNGRGNKQPTYMQISSLGNSLRFFKDPTYLLRLKFKAFMESSIC